MADQQIGVHELRQHASQYLRRVAAGESFVVTERGTPVAHLVPPAAASTLETMIGRGELVVWWCRNTRPERSAANCRRRWTWASAPPRSSSGCATGNVGDLLDTSALTKLVVKDIGPMSADRRSVRERKGSSRTRRSRSRLRYWPPESAPPSRALSSAAASRGGFYGRGEARARPAKRSRTCGIASVRRLRSTSPSRPDSFPFRHVHRRV
jgi:prevent-host-death family protein